MLTVLFEVVCPPEFRGEVWLILNVIMSVSGIMYEMCIIIIVIVPYNYVDVVGVACRAGWGQLGHNRHL